MLIKSTVDVKIFWSNISFGEVVGGLEEWQCGPAMHISILDICLLAISLPILLVQIIWFFGSRDLEKGINPGCDEF